MGRRALLDAIDEVFCLSIFALARGELDGTDATANSQRAETQNRVEWLNVHANVEYDSAE